MIIGVDFDNTLVCYDDVFLRMAREEGLAGLSEHDRQKAVREAARRSPEGDLAWQRLQGKAYGPRILEARPFEGALPFLVRCHRAGIPTWVISHKTQYAGVDPTRTDLRAAALGWMEQHHFFSAATGLSPDRFAFGATRMEKVAHVQATGCTHFVDDLAETFLEPTFPAQVQGILFDPEGSSQTPPGIWKHAAWREIEARIFDA